jgi:HNH endonuclease
LNPLYPRIAQRADHRCEYCHAPEAIFNFPFEVEHIIPSAHEGVNEEFNLALACRACNLFKADRLHAVDELTHEAVCLFDPRRQRWEEHFHVEIDSGRILGTTPIGRATVMALQINRPTQLTARRQWMRLGLFP